MVLLTQRRVLVVDGHPISQCGLVQLLKQQVDLVICGVVSDALGVIEAVHGLGPDLVVMELLMPGGRGLNLLHRLHDTHQTVPVLVVSVLAETSYAERALAMGARGYVMKRAPLTTVLTAIRCVLDGGVYVSEQIASRLRPPEHKDQVGAEQIRVATLSQREFAVFHLLGQGASTHEIAETLQLSRKTVAKYRTCVQDKLRLASAAALRQYAQQWQREALADGLQ